MRCKICNKPIKENTAGNLRYCQGHSSIFKEEDESIKVKLLKDYGCFSKGEEIIVVEGNKYFTDMCFGRYQKEYVKK